MVEIGILILAAGKSSRMRGDDKLTQKIDGVEQIKRIALSACATGTVVAVTLPDAAHPRASYLLNLDLKVISVPEAHLGMGRSISAGISLLASHDLDGVMIVPADMPEITQNDLATVMEAFGTSPNAIVQACTAQGQPGHPVVFPKSVFQDFHCLSGDRGARSVIQANMHLRKLVELPHLNATTDLDTPEDWQEWRSETK
jgi:CTP:molybdopterin cytidylyltransferase MocA